MEHKAFPRIWVGVKGDSEADQRQFFPSSHVSFKSQPVWKMLNLFAGKVNTAKINKFLP